MENIFIKEESYILDLSVLLLILLICQLKNNVSTRVYTCLK